MKKSLSSARARVRWLSGIRRYWGNGWGAVICSMGNDFTSREWASMSGLSEEAIRWILLERRADLEDE